MSAYHQMGHDSSNLLSVKELGAFAGAIASPVNETEDTMLSKVLKLKSDHFEIILDPQLYYPNSTRGHLTEWSYFPSDVDTADQSNPAWWTSIINNLSDCVIRIGVDAVCSPAIVPRTYSPEYHSFNLDIGVQLQDRMAGTGIDVLLTVLVPINDLADHQRAAEIASIITTEDISRVYLVFVSDVEARRELKEVDDLIGAMQLIKDLEGAGVRVLVGCSSSDIVLWKAAGARDCATGKFFNLRRHTSSRFEPPAGGGGQLDYWFEEALLAFLREPDLLRVKRKGLLSKASDNNPFAKKILPTIDTGGAWRALSWRQYLFWFSDVEGRMSRGEVTGKKLLQIADDNWGTIEDAGLLMEERRNDGQWVRSWRRALAGLR